MSRADGIDEAFPYPSYRPHQREITETAAEALFGNGQYDTVLIHAPTGIGKSGINVTLSRLADSSFYTTPQKKLRQQLENDDGLNRHYAVLRGRDGYQCPASLPLSKLEGGAKEDQPTCADCPVYRNNDTRSCTSEPGCTYWNAKASAMAASNAVLTFAYLVIDNHLPVQSSEQQISFGDRELLVVDECHKLEEQAASLFAGFTISENTLPEDVYNGVAGALNPDETRFTAVRDELNAVYRRASKRVPATKQWDDMSDEERQCKSFCKRYRYCTDEVDGCDRTWVVDVSRRNDRVEVSPVDVDRFLQEHVWSRADKRVLSTATIQHADQPEKWLSKLGIDPDRTKVIQEPMPFAAEQRAVDTGWMVGELSGGRDDERWGEIESAVWSLSQNHADEQGLVHTASYARARRLHERFPDRSVCDERWKSSEEAIQEWQSDRTKQMFFSPAVMDGVDLPDEQVRWQVLLKVPYPSPAESRVEHLLDEREAWDWYYETTAQSIIQSVGRGVRHMDDYCAYYVLDSCFEDVLQRAEIPQWFVDAIDVEDTRGVKA